MTTGFRRILPGVLVLAGVAFVARALGAMPYVTPLVLAIGIGATVANTTGVPRPVEAGIAKHSLLLETAIVLLGASLSLKTVIDAGPRILALVAGIVVFGVALLTLLARVAGLDRRMGSLLAAGSSICGVSAVAAVAQTCEADETQIAHAAATILLFDAITLVVFPAVERGLSVTPQFYGVWIGLSMFSTGPVAAAGFAHSTVAGRWATVTKLARNTLIGVVAVWYSIRYTGRGAGPTSPTVGRVWTDFPKFLVGFLLLATVANTGVLPAEVIALIAETSDLLFLLAFAGLGFEIRLDQMRNTGVVPVVVVGTYLVAASAVAYLLVSLAM
jgi:uncharacterized integral membrane protein (TIGR00698 family)